MKEDITLDDVSERLSQLEEEIDQAVRALSEEAHASPVARAVVAEFNDQCSKFLDAIEEGDEESISEHVVELEQAGESARIAVEADEGIKSEVRGLVVKAYQSIHDLKSQLLS